MYDYLQHHQPILQSCIIDKPQYCTLKYVSECKSIWMSISGIHSLYFQPITLLYSSIFEGAYRILTRSLYVQDQSYILRQLVISGGYTISGKDIGIYTDITREWHLNINISELFIYSLIFSLYYSICLRWGLKSVCFPISSYFQVIGLICACWNIHTDKQIIYTSILDYA